MTGNSRVDLLYRERLLSSLQLSLQQTGLAGLVAPAGSGKTVVARQLVARWPQTAVWIDLSLSHNDPVALFSRLFMSFSAQIQGFGDDTLERMLRAGEMTPVDLSVPVAHLLRAMERTFPDQVLVVLDDLHLVSDTAACDLLADLIRRAPAGWHWLLGMRPALPDPLAALVVPGKTVLIGESALRFAPEDVASLYRERHGIALSDEQIQRLLEETGGNALMVDLYRLGPRGLESLLEHLEKTLSATQWDYLLRWSLLPAEGEVDLDALLGTGACETLQELVGKVPGFHADAMGRRFSLHDVVREALRRHAESVIDTGQREELLTRCAWHMLNQGHPLGAARIYQCLGDHDGLERLIRRFGMRLLGQGLVASCRDILAEVPEAVLARSPGLLLLAGSVASLEGREAARDTLYQAMRLAQAEADPALELMTITRLLEYEGGVAGGYEQMEDLIERGERLIETVLDDLTPTAKAWVHTIFGATYQLQRFEYPTAIRHLTQAEALATANDLISLQSVITYLNFQRHMAQTRYPAALMNLEALFQVNSTGRLSGMYHTLLPMAFINWLHFNGLHQEVVEFARGQGMRFEKAGGSGLTMHTFMARWQAESLIALGQYREARDWLEHVLGGFINRQVPFLESQLYHVLSLALALCGESEEAREMAERSARLRLPLREVHQRSYHQVFLGVTWLQLGDNERAADWLRQAVETARATERHHVAVAAWCYLSLAAGRMEQAAEASEHLEQAVRGMQQYRLSHVPAWEPSLLRQVVEQGIALGVSETILKPLAELLGYGILRKELVPLLRITTLGEFSLEAHEGRLGAADFTAKQRAFLGLLLSQPSLTCSHDMMQGRLYPDAQPEQARTNLDTLISRLRRVIDGVLGKGASRRYLVVRNGLIVLQHVLVDAHRLECDGQELLRQLRTGRVFQALANGLASRFLRAYRGPFLELVGGLDEIDRVRHRLHELHRQILSEMPASLAHYPGGRHVHDLMGPARGLHPPGDAGPLSEEGAPVPALAD